MRDTKTIYHCREVLKIYKQNIMNQKNVHISQTDVYIQHNI